MAVTQKPISARIDNITLAKLDTFCAATNRKRNEVINTAVAEYLLKKP